MVGRDICAAKIALFVAAIVMFAVLTAGCNKTQQPIYGTNPGGEVKFPTDWPMPEIILPEKATAHYIPKEFSGGGKLVSDRQNLVGGEYVWYVAFDGPFAEEKVVKAVEEAILSRGFERDTVTEADKTSKVQKARKGYRHPQINVRFEIYHIKEKSIYAMGDECYVLACYKY